MKTISQIKKLYSKINWYKQGAAVHPIYIGYPWKTCLGFTLAGKRIPLNYLPFSVYLAKGNFMDVYFPQPCFRKVAEFYYQKEKNKPGFIRELKQRWEHIEVVALQKIIKKVKITDFSRLNNNELLKFYRQFSEIYTDFWREAIFIDAFDVMSDMILEKALEKDGKKIKEKDLHLLTSSEELSWIQKERAELLQLVDLVRRNKKLPRLVIKGENKVLEAQSPEFIEKLKSHANRYHWIYNDYAVVHRLDWKFFLEDLRKLLSHKENCNNEKQAIKFVLGIKKAKKQLMKKMEISLELKHTINFLVTLASWRDWRKACNQMANGALRKFIDEFRKRSGLSQREINCLWYWEVKRIFKLKPKDREILKQRNKGFFTFGDPEDGLFLGKKGEELQIFMTKLLAQNKELKGRTAFSGIVRGRVKIILSQDDFYKIKKGDILVAPNTRPEYVPIMKIAGAIISEEGGLTCHAAIVSRELKVPAIVGVQGVIAALRDGDLVEVDADKGIIKII